MTNDVEALDQLVTDGVTTLVQNTLLLVGTAVVLFFLDWRLALAALVIMPVMAFSTAWFRKRSGRAYRSVRETLGAVTATLAEDIAGMRVLQSFTRERAARENFRAVSNRYRDSNMQTVVLSGIYFPVVDFISSVATAVVLGYGSYLAFNHEMTIGVLIAFLAYLTNFFDPVQQLSQLYNTFLSAVAALDKITDLMDEEPEVRDAAGAVELAASKGASPSTTFASPTAAGRRCCTGSTSRCRPGRRWRSSAIPAPANRRSPSCSPGSTTRRRAPSRSTTSICARSPRLRCDASSASCRRKASCSQAPSPRTSPSAARRRHARRSSPPPRAVGADEFIEQLEDGYDTQLGERGSRLSLGQRQLVAFARALLADPRILILDEATSSVDIGTERKIERALRRLLHGRTAFIIAHRLSTIRDADLIVVLEHGKVVEQGTHDELLAVQRPVHVALRRLGRGRRLRSRRIVSPMAGGQEPARSADTRADRRPRLEGG